MIYNDEIRFVANEKPIFMWLFLATIVFRR